MTEREEALETVNRALPPLQELSNIFLNAKNVEQQCDAAATQSIARHSHNGNLLGAVSAVSVFIIIGVLFNGVIRNMGNAAITGIFMILYVAGPVFTFLYIRKKLGEYSPDSDPQVLQMRAAVGELSKRYESVALSNAAVINALPRDYRYLYAAQFFEQALVNGRADSMKEAVNLFEEDQHRKSLENMNRQMLFDNQRQAEMLAGIESSSRAAAVGANVSAAFSILNYLK